MKFEVLPTALLRELDQRAVSDYSVPSILLMENAGRGSTEMLCQLGVNGPVVICCGRGNNGGDGLVMARHLELRGVEVRVLVFVPPSRMHAASVAGNGDDRATPPAEAIGLTGDAAINYTIVRRSGIPLKVLTSAETLAAELKGAVWLVDALLGTGSRGEPLPPYNAVIGAMNDAGVPIMAVDLPSGLDADTGTAAPKTIRAAHTCTFVARKPGFQAPGATQYTGAIHVLDIGAPRQLLEEILQRSKGPSKATV
jgi:NAD(P)H-hydrate epimerase